MNIEPLFEELQKETSKSAFSLITKLGTFAGSKLLSKYKWDQATENYTKYFLGNHGVIQVLDMPEHISLFDIYTDVRLSKEPFKYSSVHNRIDTEVKYRNKHIEHQNVKETESGTKIAEKNMRLVVLGEPGSGKSTFLRRVGLEALLSQSKHKYDILKTKSTFNKSCFPIYIEIREVALSQHNNIEFIVLEELNKCGFSGFSDIFYKNLKGNIIYLFDGLDEIPEKKFEKTIRNIKNFIDNNREDRFIISCRTAAYQSFFNGFRIGEVAPFSSTQIKIFINKWFSSGRKRDLEKSKSLIFDLFKDGQNKSAVELSTKPLFLTFLCMVYKNTGRLPTSRSELYQQSTDILISRWNSEKFVHNDQIKANPFTRDAYLDPARERAMLTEIASNFFIRDVLFFKKSELIREVSSFFMRQRGDFSSYDPDHIIGAIAKSQGLFVERGYDIFSFPHLTIQEYLTASYLIQNPNLRNRIIKHYKSSKRWKEVFILYSGIGMCDDFILSFCKYQYKDEIKLYKSNNIFENAHYFYHDDTSKLKKRHMTIWLYVAVFLSYLSSHLDSTRVDNSIVDECIVNILNMIYITDKRLYSLYYSNYKSNKYRKIICNNSIGHKDINYIPYEINSIEIINDISNNYLKKIANLRNIIQYFEINIISDVIYSHNILYECMENAASINETTFAKVNRAITELDINLIRKEG